MATFGVLLYCFCVILVDEVFVPESLAHFWVNHGLGGRRGCALAVGWRDWGGVAIGGVAMHASIGESVAIWACLSRARGSGLIVGRIAFYLHGRRRVNLGRHDGGAPSLPLLGGKVQWMRVREVRWARCQTAAGLLPLRRRFGWSLSHGGIRRRV